tara:strand:- start:29 stop:319 length:291 start_codon:yes stop_codon:yes gene_type:complete
VAAGAALGVASLPARVLAGATTVGRAVAGKIIADKVRDKTTSIISKKNLQKEVDNPFAVATAQAKKMGYKKFKEGSPGENKRDEIAEALKRKSGRR